MLLHHHARPQKWPAGIHPQIPWISGIPWKGSKPGRSGPGSTRAGVKDDRSLHKLPQTKSVYYQTFPCGGDVLVYVILMHAFVQIVALMNLARQSVDQRPQRQREVVR